MCFVRSGGLDGHEDPLLRGKRGRRGFMRVRGISGGEREGREGGGRERGGREEGGRRLAAGRMCMWGRWAVGRRGEG